MENNQMIDAYTAKIFMSILRKALKDDRQAEREKFAALSWWGRLRFPANERKRLAVKP